MWMSPPRRASRPGAPSSATGFPWFCWTALNTATGRSTRPGCGPTSPANPHAAGIAFHAGNSAEDAAWNAIPAEDRANLVAPLVTDYRGLRGDGAMSVLLFGVSHRSAPVSVLEQLSSDEADQAKIVDHVLQSSLVTEAMVLSTCNRVEIYAVVDAFHGGLSVIGQVLAEHCGMSLHDLTKYASVRYAEAAVEHLFAVASGLDSAVIGEQQVLGQVRRAYGAAESNHTVGRTLHELAQRALSVGKRVHNETGIDSAGASVVSVALGMADSRLNGLAGRSAVVIGAGAMGALSAKHLVRAGVERVHIVNRTLPRAKRLAEKVRELGVTADAFPFDHLPPILTDADVVVSCTGAVRPVVSLADVHRGLARGREPKQRVFCPLASPRTAAPAAAALRGGLVVDRARMQRPPPPRP